MSEPPTIIAIWGYPITQTFSSQSYRVYLDNRQTVLKRLDDDCLIHGGAKLHPAIRDRLQRVRELAHPQVANFHGVQRDADSPDGAAYLIWEYLPGQTLSSWSQQPEVSAQRLLHLLKELIVTVEALHAWGLVHGSIHARNIFIDGADRPKLTHISPLLYVDQRADIVALGELFYDLADHRPDAAIALRQLAEQALSPEATLHLLASGVPSESQTPPDTTWGTEIPSSDVAHGQRGYLAPVIIVTIGTLLLSLGLRTWVHHAQIQPPTPPSASDAAMGP